MRAENFFWNTSIYQCKGSHNISITKENEQNNAEILKGLTLKNAEILR